MSRSIYDLLSNLFKPLALNYSPRELFSLNVACPFCCSSCRKVQPFNTWLGSINWERKRFLFRTVRKTVLESADVLWKNLSPVYVSVPNLTDYEEIEADYWNMPNCCGAVDGKHIGIQYPPKSGSQYFNYKKYSSKDLITACDAKYRFTYVDIGAYGSQNDAGEV